MEPYFQDGGGAERDRAPGSAKRPARGRTVLVAEDDPDVRLMIGTMMEMRGYRVAQAADGQETLEVARAERPDIILMDLQLPRLNGFSVARFIRQEDALRRVPIIVVSAHDPAKHRALALAAGCNSFVTKPIDFNRLEELMRRLMDSA
ncbi:MAG TPA: response regulator [Pyrinomonadaceae bacterium]|nr:response regulator [Pyrinomonadaceae bacterium]